MRYLIAVLALAGAVVAALALEVHYSTATEPCSINEKWDCGVVNHSPFAVMAHVPVAAIGIAGYLAIGVLAFTRQRLWLHIAAFVALIFSLRLTFIEQFDLLVWCLYCVISQSIIAIIALLSLGWLAADYLRLKRTGGYISKLVSPQNSQTVPASIPGKERRG
jgi:vitamin-K-epoxide reductase (warfarin-sensitive)